MENQRVEQTGLSDSIPPNHHLSYSLLHEMNNPATGFINQGQPSVNYGELEEAMLMQGLNFKVNESLTSLLRPSATLKMFPSWPMGINQTARLSAQSGVGSTDSGSGLNTSFSCQATDQQQIIEPESPISNKRPNNITTDPKPTSDKRKDSTSENQVDAKTMRRLAQNREAAKKSRLRKKAYVQQLEFSRNKLNQLEQELQQARSQGAGWGGMGSSSSGPNGAAIFDMEYGRWLEEENRNILELRAGLQTQLPDNGLGAIVDRYISHYDKLFRLKAEAVQIDVFHVLSGMWTSPAERCFLWIGGFRPSELIKMLIPQVELQFTEQQMMGIYSLQHSSQQAEETLTQGLDQLHQSLVLTVAGPGFQQLSLAMAKLSNLEGFLCQSDSLRQQTLHNLRRILTVRQAARCFLMIGEYYGRLRALSSLWASRPRESLMGEDMPCQTATDMPIMPQASHNTYNNF